MQRRFASRLFVVAAVLPLLLTIVQATSAPPAVAAGTSINSSGPLSSITVNPDLSCAVVYNGAQQFEGGSACGTFVAVGGTLYGPSVPGGPATTPFTPRTQFLTGTGVASDPRQIISVVDLGTTGLTLTETDSYVVGLETYRTSIGLSNATQTSQSVTVYRVGDCAQGLDIGYGKTGAPAGAIACTTAPNGGGGLEQFLPLVSGSAYQQGAATAVWSAVAARTALPNTCACNQLTDHAIGLSWTVTVAAGNNVFGEDAATLNTFSDAGLAPLSMTKTADKATANIDAADGYTITVTNPNASPVTLRSISDILPEGFIYTAGSTSGATTADPSLNGQNLIWGGTFAVPATGNLSLHFGVTVSHQQGTYSNQAAADADPTMVVGTGPTAPVVVENLADVGVSVTDSPDPVVAGGTVNYSVHVVNGGPDPAYGVALSFALPTQATLVSFAPSTPLTCFVPQPGTTGTIRCNLDSLPKGGDEAMSVAVAVPTGLPDGTVLHATAQVSSATTDENSANDTFTADTTVSSGADLALTKSCTPDPVTAGTDLSCTITLTTAGPSDAQNVTVQDEVPADAFVSSFTPPQGWNCGFNPSASGATFRCDVGRVPATASPQKVTLVLHVASSETGPTVSDTATVSSTTSDPNPENNTATSQNGVQAQADLGVAKECSPDPVTAGGNVNCTITLSNTGPSDAHDVVLDDPLGPDVVFFNDFQDVNWNCTFPPQGASGTIHCNIPALAAGAQPQPLTLFLGSSPGATGPTFSNSVSVSSSDTDPNPDNNHMTSTNQLQVDADVAVNKGCTPDPVVAGTDFNCAITVTKTGSSDAQSVSLDDQLPSQTTLVSVNFPFGWNCSAPTQGTTGLVHCDAGTMHPGASPETVFMVLHAAPGTPGGSTIDNTATVSSPSDQVPGDNTSTSEVHVTSQADLEANKACTPDPVVAGSDLTCTITVRNSGPSDAASVSIDDVVPAGTTFASASPPPSWTCTSPPVGSQGTYHCDLASLPVGRDIHVFSMVVHVAPSMPPGSSVSNTVSVSAAASGDPHQDNNSATAVAHVSTLADLGVTKTCSPDPVAVGTDLSCTITVVNAGPSDAAGVSVDDPLPQGTTFVSASPPDGWHCTTPAVGENGTVSCGTDTLGVGLQAQLSLSVHVSPSLTGTTLSNTVNVTSATPERNIGDNSANSTVSLQSDADVGVSKTCSPDPVVAGTNLTCTITVTNAGPATAQSVVLQDTLPRGSTFVSGVVPDVWTCTLSTVDASAAFSCRTTSLAADGPPQTATIVIGVPSSAAAGSTVSNTATVRADNTDRNPANNSSTATNEVSTQANLNVSKTCGPDPVVAGTDLTCTVRVGNAGPSGAANVFMRDTLPAGTTFVANSAPGGWTCTSPEVGAQGTLECKSPMLAVGASPQAFPVMLHVPARAAAGSSVINTATVTSDAFDPHAEDNSSSATTRVTTSADLAVTKSCSPDPVTAGTDLTCTITVTNAGPSDAATVLVSDTLPDANAFGSLGAPGGWSCTVPTNGVGDTASCSIASLAAGAAPQRFTLVIHVPTSAAGGSTVSDTATVRSASSDPAPTNNSSTAVNRVVSQADLSVAKSCSPEPVVPGSQLTCTLTVGNGGPADAHGVVITDDLPAGVSLVGTPAGDGFSCTTKATSPEITCTRATLTAGPTGGTITYRLAVSQDLGPGVTLTNTASVSSDTPEADPRNNTATHDSHTPACTIDRRNATAGQEIVGTSGNDVICGSPYNDDINGVSGNDVIFAGAGNDEVHAAPGSDVIFGGDGNDDLHGGGDNDVLYGQAGNDRLAGDGGVDRADGGAGVDTCKSSETKVNCER